MTAEHEHVDVLVDRARLAADGNVRGAEVGRGAAGTAAGTGYDHGCEPELVVVPVTAQVSRSLCSAWE